MLAAVSRRPPAPLTAEPFIAFDVQVRDRVGSTNDELRELTMEGAPHGTVLRAAEQTAGRGRQGRSWRSPPGNLHMSVLLRPATAVVRPAEIAFVAGLAVADAVDTALPPGKCAQLKWPNDVLVAGAKIAGLLAEWVDGAAVVGIGLNIAHAPADLPYQATCLREHCHSEPAVAAVADSLLAALAARWMEWLRDGFGPVRESWLRRGPAHGAPLSVSVPGETVVGAFDGLDADGALLLRTGAVVRRIVAGDAVPRVG